VRDERRLDMHHVDPARIDTSERAVECAADHQPIFRVHRHASRSDAVHARPDLADRPPRSAAPPACSGADRSRTSPAGRWRSRSRHRSRAGRTRPKSSGCARWPALVRWRARLPGSDDGRVTFSGSAPPGPFGRARFNDRHRGSKCAAGRRASAHRDRRLPAAPADSRRQRYPTAAARPRGDRRLRTGGVSAG